MDRNSEINTMLTNGCNQLQNITSKQTNGCKEQSQSTT
jgi:hypothetical protein